MAQRSSDYQKGFSLVELLIYLVLFLLILGSILQIFESHRSTYASGEKKMDAQQNARVAMDEIARQLRMAGYFPENFDSNSGNDLDANAIQVATDTALAVLGDADGSGTSNVFLFCLDGSNLRRGKGTNGVANAYTCSSGEILAQNITSLRFTYYDSNNASLPNPPTTPYVLDGEGEGAVPSFSDVTQRDAVRRVVTTITVTEAVPRQASQVYTLTSDVRLRNVN